MSPYRTMTPIAIPRSTLEFIWVSRGKGFRRDYVLSVATDRVVFMDLSEMPLNWDERQIAVELMAVGT